MLQLGESGPQIEVRIGEGFPEQVVHPASAPPAPIPEPPTVPSSGLPLGPGPVAAPTPPAEAAPVYQAHQFSMPLPEGWQDRTVYTLIGPLNDELQHNITINVEPDVPFDTVAEYADEQVKVLEGELQGCQVLKKEAIALYSGLPAYRALFVWYPTEALKVYQEQIYVLQGKTAYRLTASFTRKTRKLLGPQVEHIMLGFTPTA